MGELSECIRARVQVARDIQTRRFGVRPRSVPTSGTQSLETLHSIVWNADMRIGEIRQFCKLPEDGQSLMRAALNITGWMPFSVVVRFKACRMYWRA